MEPERQPEALTAEPGDASQRLLGPLDNSGFAQAGRLAPDHGGAGDDPPDGPWFRRVPPGNPILPLVGRSFVLSGGPAWQP